MNTNITSQRYVPTGAPVQVQVLDANGVLITSVSVPVMLSIANDSGGGILTSTVVNAVGGIATFPALSISKTGLGYVLAASTTAASIDPGASSRSTSSMWGRTAPVGRVNREPSRTATPVRTRPQAQGRAETS